MSKNKPLRGIYLSKHRVLATMVKPSGTRTVPVMVTAAMARAATIRLESRLLLQASESRVHIARLFRCCFPNFFATKQKSMQSAVNSLLNLPYSEFRKDLICSPQFLLRQSSEQAPHLFE